MTRRGQLNNFLRGRQPVKYSRNKRRKWENQPRWEWFTGNLGETSKRNKSQVHERRNEILISLQETLSQNSGQFNWAAINKQTKANRAYNIWDHKKLKTSLKVILILSQKEKHQNIWVSYSTPLKKLPCIPLKIQHEYTLWDFLTISWPYLGILQSTFHAVSCFCWIISSSQCLYLLTILIPSWETCPPNLHTQVCSCMVVWNLPPFFKKNIYFW